jgi:hypothetical protein
LPLCLAVLGLLTLVNSRGVRAVTRDDIEDVRDALDAAIAAYLRAGPGDGRLAPKTAQNIWSELTVSSTRWPASRRRDPQSATVDFEGFMTRHCSPPRS